MLNITLGFSSDHRTDLMVLEHSIRSRTSIPIDFRYAPLHESVLARPREPNQTTPFAFTRFLTPFMCKDAEFSLFMDPDMLCLCDIKELYDLIDPQYAVQVVKHDYTPSSNIKYVGGIMAQQLPYARKNWSSLIIFNHKLCEDIYTFDAVTSLSGLALNTFANVPDELIGELPKPYNYLVGEPNQENPAKIVHFTNGTPMVAGFEQCEYATEWTQEFDNALKHNHY